MSRPLNGAQKAVLAWVAAGAHSHPPSDTYKISAAALKSRGLLQVRRPGGVWTAALTDAGLHYVQNGGYPATPAAGRSGRRLPDGPTRVAPPALSPTTSAERRGQAPELPVLTSLRRPHPAVREFIDRPGRLPTPYRRRCQLILHTLVQEAGRRGWSIRTVSARTRRDAWGKVVSHYDSPDLLVVDAGACPVGIQFTIKTKRIDHVETDRERRAREAGQYSWAPRFDHVPTDLLRLHLTHGGSKVKTFEDTARVPIEDKLARVIEAIATDTDVVLERRERQQLEAIAAEEHRKERERVSRLRAAYEAWEIELDAGADAWELHSRRVAWLAALEARPRAAAFATFIEWSKAHLDATDPMRSASPRSDDVPQWSHEDRVRHGRPAPAEPRPYEWFRPT